MTQRSRQVHRGIARGGRDQRGSVAEDRGQRAESEGRGRSRGRAGSTSRLSLVGTTFQKLLGSRLACGDQMEAFSLLDTWLAVGGRRDPVRST